MGEAERESKSHVIERVDPRSDSYSALMWDVVTNAHRYQPRPGDKVLDLGAHYGMFSLYCAARGAIVDAFEPQPIPYRELVHSAEVAKEIGFGSIMPHMAAVWTEATELQLIPAANGSTATASAMRLGYKGCKPMQVWAVAFDDILRGYDRWDCVKMDVEGAESELLLSSKELDRIGYLTVEIHNDILPPGFAEEIDRLLRCEFQDVRVLPRKDDPHQVVAYFCGG